MKSLWGSLIGTALVLCLACLGVGAYFVGDAYLDGPPVPVVPAPLIVYENQTIVHESEPNVTFQAPARDLERMKINVDFNNWSGSLAPLITISYAHPEDDLGHILQVLELRQESYDGVDLCNGMTIRYEDWFLQPPSQDQNATSISYQNSPATFPFTGFLLPGDECGARVGASSSWNVTFKFEIDGELSPTKHADGGGFIIDEWDAIRSWTLTT